MYYQLSALQIFHILYENFASISNVELRILVYSFGNVHYFLYPKTHIIYIITQTVFKNNDIKHDIISILVGHVLMVRVD